MTFGGKFEVSASFHIQLSCNPENWGGQYSPCYISLHLHIYEVASIGYHFYLRIVVASIDDKIGAFPSIIAEFHQQERTGAMRGTKTPTLTDEARARERKAH